MSELPRPPLENPMAEFLTLEMSNYHPDTVRRRTGEPEIQEGENPHTYWTLLRGVRWKRLQTDGNPKPVEFMNSLPSGKTESDHCNKSTVRKTPS